MAQGLAELQQKLLRMGRAFHMRVVILNWCLASVWHVDWQDGPIIRQLPAAQFKSDLKNLKQHAMYENPDSGKDIPITGVNRPTTGVLALRG